MSAVYTRFYFDLPREDDGTIIEGDYASIKVLELDSYGDTGTAVATVPISAGVDYIQVDKSLIHDVLHWFVLQLLDSLGNVLVTSDPVVCEDAGDKIISIREAVKDTSASPAFSDNELMEKIRLAALRLIGNRNVSKIPDRLWAIMEVLVRIDICNVLAFDFAKYMKLEIPGGASLSKDQLYEHYINVAKQLENYYQTLKADLLNTNEESGESVVQGVVVSSMTRDSYETGMLESDLTTATDYESEALKRLRVGS